MVSFMEKIQARLEIYRLEKRYTRNRNRRSTFISNAVYVDGEYVYNTPQTTGSSTNSSAMSSPIDERESYSLKEPRSPTYEIETPTPVQKKRLNRFSMPGFGSLTKVSRRDPRPSDDYMHEER